MGLRRSPVSLLYLSRYTDETAGFAAVVPPAQTRLIRSNALLYLVRRRSISFFASIACSSSILTAFSPVSVDPTRPTYLSTFLLVPFDLSYRQK